MTDEELQTPPTAVEIADLVKAVTPYRPWEHIARRLAFAYERLQEQSCAMSDLVADLYLWQATSVNECLPDELSDRVKAAIGTDRVWKMLQEN